MRNVERGAQGSTVVEFLAVAVLTVVCMLGVAQLAIWVWARNVAVTATHEGARTAAESGRPLEDGVTRARSLLRDGLGGSARGFAVEVGQSGGSVAVRAHGNAPRIMPFLPSFTVDSLATALDEDFVLP
ncbi:MAG: pilus assembly protein [Acidimicrobiia bacterium]|nr:pilus assembly protein [Acidimicrobiia bacterium]